MRWVTNNAFLSVQCLNFSLQVTSTVTIPTPEQVTQEEAGDTPSVWEGTVIMPDVCKFKVRSYQVLLTQAL